MSSSDPKWHNSSAGCRGLVMTEEALSNGASELETAMEDHSVGGGGDHLALGSDGMSEISNSDLSLPEICISTNSNSFDEDMNYELQQAYRIFTGFLLDKHKGITSPFLQPIGHLEAQHGIGGVRGRGQAQLRQSMCLQRMEEKFANQEYETIAEFVADFRLMLENCYRYHGVDHWISKQAQKLEIMLEQKLMLLSRTLREKTTLAVTSKGRFSAEEERGSGGSSTRRRSAPRSLATLTVGGHESIMVQALRLEEQQRIKEEKRQRELEKKEAEETSAKEVEEWEQSLLLQASPHPVDTLWELPAIGHFLCLAQTALNLPEIVFYELERCLLMPCSSIFLSKIMSSLLCSSQKRTTLQRRPALPYRCWEKDLRRRVLGWYQAVGACRDQPSRAEQLGLCHQFFTVVGEVSPLEETPFHLLSFYQRVWLLKGLCDNVYETQKHVQDAVLAQPIHECRESILGYDGVENAYIHFPHFCGADLRIYCQSPSMPPAFPFPPVWVKKVEIQPGNDESDATENVKDTNEKGCSVTGDSEDSGNEKEEKHTHFKMENWGKEAKSERFNSMFLKEESSDSVSSDADDTSEDSKPDVKVHADSSSLNLGSAAGRTAEKTSKKTPFELELRPTCSHRLTTAQELDSSLGLERTIKAETQDPCLSVGEHSYTGRSPVCTMSLVSPAGVPEVKVEGGAPTEVRRASCLECSRSNTGDVKSEPRNCHCHPSGIAATSSPERMQNLGKERMKNRIRAKRKKRKKSCESEQLLGVKVEPSQLRRLERTRKCQAQAAKTAAEQAAFPVKTNKRKKIKPGEKEKRLDSSKKIKEEPKVKPAFKLVCISLQELRELISKTEDELDELESTKKRSGRWYFKKEAVKDLHITLIRLLNELSPWEPKLVKAYQRNRLRLKKEFDDSKKHPDGNNFVSDECVSTSSEDEGRLLGRGVCSPPDHYRACEEEDLEHAVPRGLWTGGSSRQLVAESIGCNVTYKNSYHLKHLLSTNVDVILQREQMVSGSLTSSPVCELESSSNPVITAQSRDLNLAFEAVTPAHASSRGRPPILSPTTGLPKGYTPIPTLLAKSVGNKVTLMKRPDDYQGLSHLDGQIKGQMCSTPLSAVVSTKRSQAQRTPSEPQQTLQETCTEGSDQPKEDLKSVASITTTATTAAPPKPLQTKLTPPMAVPKSTVKVVYKVPVGLDHLLKKDATNPVKITVQPLVDQNTGEKIMKQVVILPPNLLLQKNNEICFQHQPHQSDVASPLCMSSSVPGFTIPDGSIPVQQVASLNDARTVMTPSPALSPCLQQSTVSMKDLKLAQACSSQAITPKSVIQNQLPIPSTTAVLTDSTKLTDPKQELKTVCVRDSQSILVTTRGGNTGIVKIQTSSEQSVRGSLPASPVITISPQFKAFLVSQSTSTQTTSCPASTTTSILTAQLQKQCPSAATAPLLTSVPASYTTGTAVTLSKGDVSPVSSLPAKSGPNAQTIDATQTQTSPLKSSMIVPPLTCSVTHIPSQAQLINNCGVKRANSDEGSQFTKYILVTPSSPSSLSNAAAPKVTSSLNAPTPLSRVLFIDESAAASSTTTSIGSLPKQVPVTGINQPPLTTALSSEVLKMSLSLGQPLDSIKSEALSKIKNFAPPSGVQIHLPGQVTNLGQSIDSVLHSSKSTSAAISTGLVFLKSSDMLTSSPAHLASTLTTSSQHKGLSSISTETPRCTSTVVTPSSRCIFTKGMDLAKGLPTNKSVAHIPAMGQHSQSNTTPVTLAHQSQNVLTAVTTLSPVVMSPHTSTSVANPNSIARSTNSLITTTPTLTTTATAGTIQQRIVINTSSRLAAGTQILLNNTRFVVPPQGLGPGSHVLIISSHGPQQVPSANNPPYSAAAQAPGPSQVSAMLKPTALPGLSPLKLHSLPTLSSPIAVHKPVGGSSLLATMPNVGQVRLAGAHVMESSFPSSTTKMSSSLPRLQGAQDRGSSVVGGQSLASSPIRLGGTQALVSAVITKASTCSSALHNTGLSPGTLSRCPPHLSTLSPSPNLPRFPIPLSSRVNASPSAVSLTDSIIGTQSPLTSVVAQSTAVFSGTPCLSSAPLAQPGESGPGSPPQQIALGNPAPCTLASTIPQATPQTGIINPSIKQQLTAMQPQQRSTQSQVLQAVAAPRIVNTLPRMQSLPVATVQPAGGAISSFQVSPLANHFPSSSTVKQIISLKISETVHPPVPTNPEWGKANLQTVSTAGHTNIASKLLVSPDGAVLNTIQGPVHQASLPTCSKQLSRLVILPSGALSTHHPMNSSAQLTKADTGKP